MSTLTDTVMNHLVDGEINSIASQLRTHPASARNAIMLLSSDLVTIDGSKLKAKNSRGRNYTTGKIARLRHRIRERARSRNSYTSSWMDSGR